MRGIVITLLLLFSLTITQANETDIKNLVSEFHVCLNEGNVNEANDIYEQLRKTVPAYIGYYRDVTAMYMSVCIEQLGIDIGPEDIKKLYDMRMRFGGASDKGKARILSQIAEALYEYGQYAESLPYYEDFISLEKSLDPVYFHRQLMKAAWVYNYSERPQKAYLSFRSCAEFFRKQYGEYSKNYADALNALSYVSQFVNADKKEFLQQEYDIHTHRNDTLSLDFAVCLDNIASYHTKKGNLQLAMEYCRRANKIFEEISRESGDYAISLNNLGSIYHRLGKSDPKYIKNAEEYFLESLEIYPRQITALNLMQLYDDDWSMPQKAESCLGYLNQEDCHSTYAWDVAEHYAKVHNYEAYALYMSEHLDYIRSMIKENVCFMSASERAYYSRKIQETDMKRLFELASERRHPDLSGLCFDYLLMSKSLQLSYDANIGKIIRHSQNRELKDMQFSLNILKHDMSRNPALKNKVDSLEHAFLDKLRSESNFASFMDYKYDDVRNRLSSEEAVLEFYHTPDQDDSRLYAVVLTGAKDPVVVKCCEGDQEVLWGKNKILGKSIWDGIEPYLKKVSRVYFSPHGSLYNYPLESEISTLRPELEMYRVSSSRILLDNPERTGEGSAIYGGLSYDMGINDMLADAKRYCKGLRRGLDGNIPVISVSRQSIVDLVPLPATLTEADNISDILKSGRGEYSRNVDKFTADKGTEASVKNLSGKSKRILHIATHGFYDRDGIRPDEAGDDAKALSYSGLCMAGANNIYKGEDVPGNIDDGILTALEISELDMRGMELVVLSACQTGQGMVTNDGVFGLQRGFKKAGVKSILMSLWEVDDEATCVLMTEFYKNLVDGHSKHKALELAKRAVREQKDKGWDDPYYWASFILLDGVESGK